MKKQIILAVSATALTFFSATVWADDLNNANTNYPNANYSRDQYRDRDEAQLLRGRHHGDLRKADRLMGLAIKNDAGETIGKVKDLALDLQNARIVSVIVATGGFAGVDRKLVAVPPSLFTYDEPNKSLHTSIDQNQLKNAPNSNSTIGRMRPRIVRFTSLTSTSACRRITAPNRKLICATAVTMTRM